MLLLMLVLLLLLMLTARQLDVQLKLTPCPALAGLQPQLWAGRCC